MSNDLLDLNFKVDKTFHRTYKLVATLKGMSMKELLEQSFETWVNEHGDKQLKELVKR